MRLRFNSKRFFLDNEWGFIKNLPKEEPEQHDPVPHYVPTPMTEDPRQRLGFRFQGNGGEIVTGDI